MSIPLLDSFIPAIGGATGIKYTLNTTAGTPVAGEIRSADLAVAGTIAISATDAASPGKSAADILARIKVGAIIEIAESLTKRIRATVTTDYTVGSGSFVVSTPLVDGAIGNGAIVFLSIASDAPSTVVGGTGRITATANRTYYVRSTGTRLGNLSAETDATNNTDADAFSTVSACLLALKKLDFQGFIPTVFVQSGTFSGVIDLPTLLGADFARLKGNGVANTIFTFDGALTAFLFHGVIQSLSIFTVWQIEDCKVTTTANNRSAILCGNGKILFSNIQTDSHFIDIWCLDSGIIEAAGNYSFSRNKQRHIYSEGNGVVRIQSRTITVSGAIAFSEAGVFCAYGSPLVVINGNTYAGSATGKRYQSDFGGRIIASTGTTYLPGSVDGSVTSGFYDAL
jgi:hypothetical protein